MLGTSKYFYLAFGPQSACGLPGNRFNLSIFDFGVAAANISKLASSFGALLNIAAAGDRTLSLLSFTGCNFAQHRMMSHTTKNTCKNSNISLGNYILLVGNVNGPDYFFTALIILFRTRFTFLWPQLLFNYSHSKYICVFT